MYAARKHIISYSEQCTEKVVNAGMYDKKTEKMKNETCYIDTENYIVGLDTILFRLIVNFYVFERIIRIIATLCSFLNSVLIKTQLLNNYNFAPLSKQ